MLKRMRWEWRIHRKGEEDKDITEEEKKEERRLEEQEAGRKWMR